MPRIKLKSITFGDVPFRKLKSITIEIAPAITIIAGHNGIGKSTILGLLANSSGLTTRSKAPNSYFEKLFQANLSEIIYIDYDSEFINLQEADLLPRPVVEYSINQDEVLKKRCALTDRSDSDKARIVPRNLFPSSQAFESQDGSVKVGPASKVPVPTIYLGLTRLMPLGEAEDGSGYNHPVTMKDKDARLVTEFMDYVIPGSGAKHGQVTSNRIKGTSKFSSHPEYGYNAKCVSIGQDSLGSIAGAVASFQLLHREWPDYPGGILIVDELDSGFHPFAIKKLVERLAVEAERLKLQIIATTHSTKLIEAVFSHKSKRKNDNAVVYLMDTRSPHLLDRPTLQDILDEMELRPPHMQTKAAAPQLRVYLEDKEALLLFNLLVPAHLKRSLGITHGVSIKAIAMGVGCDSMANLTSIDPHFKCSIFALDGDADIKPRHKRLGNIVQLPGDSGLSPERTLFKFINSLVDNQSLHKQTWLTLQRKRISSDQIKGHLLDWDGDVSNRKAAKKWWRERWAYMQNWKMYEAWMIENQEAVDQFQNDFSTTVKLVAKRVRTLAKSAPND